VTDQQQPQRPKRLRAETDLYAPVKRFLQARGLDAKGEVRGCDVVAVAPGEPDLPIVVELKPAVTLAGVLQCVDRFAVTDLVYLAVPAAALPWSKNDGDGFKRLCRRLGLGLLAVGADGAVSALAEPLPARTPRRNRLRAARVLAEHTKRRGDPTPGGRPGGVRQMTAYRKRALRCAAPPCSTARPAAARSLSGPCAKRRRRRTPAASCTGTSTAGSSRRGATCTV
jgi:hypothetical protein